MRPCQVNALAMDQNLCWLTNRRASAFWTRDGLTLSAMNGRRLLAAMPRQSIGLTVTAPPINGCTSCMQIAAVATYQAACMSRSRL